MRHTTSILLWWLSWLAAPGASAQGSADGQQLRMRLEISVYNQIEMQLMEPVATLSVNNVAPGRQNSNSVVNNQFAVVSNEPYGITVTTGSNFLQSGDGRIPVSTISMNVLGSSENDWLYPIQSLSTRHQNLSKMAPPTASQSYSIMYRLKPDRTISRASAGTYYASLVFTITSE